MIDKRRVTNPNISLYMYLELFVWISEWCDIEQQQQINKRKIHIQTHTIELRIPRNQLKRNETNIMKQGSEYRAKWAINIGQNYAVFIYKNLYWTIHTWMVTKFSHKLKHAKGNRKKPFSFIFNFFVCVSVYFRGIFSFFFGIVSAQQIFALAHSHRIDSVKM